ncbi:hypothetical protein [Streptomyces calvus]
MTDDPSGLRCNDLLRAAASAGLTVSERLLEEFRRHSLVPRPIRVGNDGRRPVWVYPPGSDRQLVRLLRWREHTKNNDVLRVMLWLEGFPIALAIVRTSASAAMDALLSSWEQGLRTAACRQGLDPEVGQEAVLAAAARATAAKRGENALPRPIRVPADDRATAVKHLLQIFGLGQRPEMTEEDAETIEKVLGVSPGRRQRVEGAGPWLAGPATDILDAADFVSLPKMSEALSSATDSELEAARPLAAALFLQLPVVARALTAVYGKENFAGMGGFADLDQEPTMGVLLTGFVLGAFHAGWGDNVETTAESLATFPSLVDEMRDVLDMPQSKLSRNLAAHGPETRDRTQRIIDALQDSEFDAGHRFRN